jgi:hypothetical protein
MDTQSGNLIYFKKWGTAVTVAGAGLQTDVRANPNADANICRAVAFDKDTRQIVFLMEYV